MGWSPRNLRRHTGSMNRSFTVPSEADIGFHTVQFTFEDNNACGHLQSTCVFDIKVMCRYCPTCVYYENRSPGGLPYPSTRLLVLALRLAPMWTMLKRTAP